MVFSENTDFHDAIVHSVTVDFSFRKVVIQLSAYENSESKTRTKAECKFQGVQRFSALTNFEILFDNQLSGNVSYLSKTNKTSYLHLIGGVIEIEAEDMAIFVIY